MEPAAGHPSRTRFTALLAGATLLLICAGGLVTSHEAGLAVPDWPNTYGYNMFFFPLSQWVGGGILYEHSHRLIASGVGFLTTILVLWLHGVRAQSPLRWGGVALLAAAVGLALTRWAGLETAGLMAGVGLLALGVSFVWPGCAPAPLWLRRLGIVAWLAVVVQGVLGGLRVVMLKNEIGIFHATLAQLFFALICALALLASTWWNQARAGTVPASAFPRWLPAAITGLILGQLVLGATMRHRHAGLAIPDFPAAYGRLWPATDPNSIIRYNQARTETRWVNPITASDVLLHMAHRLTGFLIVGLLTAAAAVAWRRLIPGNPLRRAVIAWAVLGWLQLLLGAATVWTGKSADIATAHVAVGSLLLAAGTLASLLARRLVASARTVAPAFTPPVPASSVLR